MLIANFSVSVALPDLQEYIDNFLKTMRAEDAVRFTGLAQTLNPDMQLFLAEHISKA